MTECFKEIEILRKTDFIPHNCAVTYAHCNTVKSLNYYRSSVSSSVKWNKTAKLAGKNAFKSDPMK